MKRLERRPSTIAQRKLILARLEKLENDIEKEKDALNGSRYQAKYLRARIHRKQRDQGHEDWKNTHPLKYQTVNMNDYQVPSSSLDSASSIHSSRSSSSRFTNTAKATIEGLPITPIKSKENSAKKYISKVPSIKYTPYQFHNGTVKTPPSTQRTESDWLQEPKYGRKKTIITTIPDLQHGCSSIRRADGPGYQPLTARRHASDITLCVDYVVNPTPAMMEIGTNFHKTLTPLVKDREVLHENTLPWRKTAQELQNEPKFVTWK